MTKDTYIRALAEIDKMPEEYREAATADLRKEYMDDFDRLIRANHIETVIEEACHDTIWEYAAGRINIFDAISECVVNLRIKKEEVWNDILNGRIEAECTTPAEEE